MVGSIYLTAVTHTHHRRVMHGYRNLLTLLIMHLAAFISDETLTRSATQLSWKIINYSNKLFLLLQSRSLHGSEPVELL